jgi:hypothetical protein
MKFAKAVFTLAGIYGVLSLLIVGWVNRNVPPPAEHPESYYGFAVVALTWQFAFLVIGRDPLRYRPIMIPAFFEKALYVAAIVPLYLQQRVDSSTIAFAIVDTLLGVLFLAAYIATRRAAPAEQANGEADSSGVRSALQRG